MLDDYSIRKDLLLYFLAFTCALIGLLVIDILPMSNISNISIFILNLLISVSLYFFIYPLLIHILCEQKSRGY